MTEIQKFVGALSGKKAKKGIFITTSRFTKEAESYEPQNDIKLSTLGKLSNNNNEKCEVILNYENESIKLNYTRVETGFRIKPNEYIMIYGNLKVIRN